MQASLFPIAQDNLSLVHPQARRSVFWELEATAVAAVEKSGHPEFEKEAWLSTTLFEQKTCGYSIGYLNPDPIPSAPAISTVLYCLRDYAPGAATLPTAPVSKDAALITSLFIDEVFRGVGMEAVLLDAALVDLIKMEVPAVEAFGIRDLKINGSIGLDPTVREIAAQRNRIGLIEVEMLESAGFEVVADHPVLPRLRMEMPPQDPLMSAMEAQLLLASVEVH
ncbi:hypothetical protein CFAEC_13585 [Corynebacterium faecale]|uniref:hypothetical protein n=1 Tax=Corynebacterium faecale TaxID=1758466 RepID=UPI0025B5382C|nr:hypothetical protein [Corynebacterium faecale]WJY93502.1 hypothetical protein CFAEC_13585 [Corynebacterium faecale]